MSNYNEQFDMIHDVLGHIMQRLDQLSALLGKLADVKTTDYSRDFERINKEVAATRQELTAFISRVLAPINSLERKMENMPHTVQQKHHHHFDLRSKGFIISAAILLIVTAFCSGLSLSLWCENRLLHNEALKYRMVRFINPTTARLTDSLYYRNPQAAERITDKLESGEQTDVSVQTKNANSGKQNYKSK